MAVAGLGAVFEGVAAEGLAGAAISAGAEGALAGSALAGGAAAAGAGAGATLTAGELAGGLTGLSGGALAEGATLGAGASGVAGLEAGGAASATEQAAHFGADAFEAAGSPHTAGVFDGLDFNSALKFASPASSIFSGFSALQQAEELKKQAALARTTSNPWAASGGQAFSTQQLMDLLANPGNVASNDPAYKLRIQGAQRATATQGQGSGAMAVAGANASTSWYNDRLAQLSTLSGAPGNPVGTAQVGLQGQIAAGDLMSRGLGSIGFGTNTLAGGSVMTPQIQQWLKQTGFPGAA